MNLVGHLVDRARRHPDRLAIIDGPEGRERKTTFAELAGMVSAASRRLRADGLQPGDTLLIFQPVSLELYVVLLGAMHAGVVGVFLDPSASPEFVAAACAKIHPAGLFGSRKAQILRWKHPAIRKIPRVWCPRWFPGTRTFSPETGAIESPAAVSPDAPALITFTSGSTGFPKAAVRTHGFLLAQHAALAEAIHLREGETDLLALPVFALANLASGLTTLLPAAEMARPAEVDVRSVARQAAVFGATRCAGSPALFRRFLDEACLPDFQAIFTGGAPVFPSLLDRLQLTRPQMAIHAVYGSTEAEPIAELDWGEFSRDERQRVADGAGLPAGRPTAAIDLAILPDATGRPIAPMTPGEFAAIRLPAGETGEIVVSGDHVLPGYLDGEGDGETKIRVGGTIWHRTGDAGRMEPDGCLWLLGRCAAAVRLPGRTIYPFEIEAALDGRADIGRCAVLELDGQGVLVVESPGPLPDDLVNRAAVAGISRVLARPALPMDRRHQAKIDYPALRKSIVRPGHGR